MNIIVSIYSTANRYPPTLNAITELSKVFDRVILLERSNENDNWEYPHNVETHAVRINSESELMNASKYRKIKDFYTYVKLMKRLIKRNQPKIVLVYDGIAMLALNIISGSSNKFKTWYHNHDVIEGELSPLGLPYWAKKVEVSMFKKLDYFSLPVIERKAYFPLENFKGTLFYIPNFPCKAFYSSFNESFKRKQTSPLKIIYQGRVSEEHGLDEIIEIIADSKIQFTIIGPGGEKYLDDLKSKVEKHPNISLLKPVPYEKLPAITREHHVGLAINIPKKIIYKTGGTASNKIYEYAALGLPVIYYDDPHYNQYLNKFQWAFKTKLEKKQFLQCLTDIKHNYPAFSSQAELDFSNKLNFELYFDETLKKILEN